MRSSPNLMKLLGDFLTPLTLQIWTLELEHQSFFRFRSRLINKSEHTNMNLPLHFNSLAITWI